MIHYYQEELNAFVEKAAEFFGLTSVGIYGQFIVMLGTISFLNFGEHSSLFIVPSIENYPSMQTISFVFGIAAKFFTTCVGAIATIKFVCSVIKGVKNKFKKKED